MSRINEGWYSITNPFNKPATVTTTIHSQHDLGVVSVECPAILCKNKNNAFFLASVWWQAGASSQPQCSRSLWDRLFFSLRQACHQPSCSCLSPPIKMECYTLCAHQKTKAKKQHYAFGVEKEGRKKTLSLSLCVDSSRRGLSGFVPKYSRILRKSSFNRYTYLMRGWVTIIPWKLKHCPPKPHLAPRPCC